MEIKLYKSRWKALLLLVGSVVFVLGAVLMLRDPDASHFWAWCSICLFGPAIPLWLFNVFDRRPQIILNEIGIFDRTGYTEYIHWEVIQGAYTLEINWNKFLCVIVDKQYEPSRKKKLFTRLAARMNRSGGAQELNINLVGVSVDAKKLEQFILEVARLTPEERKERMRQG